MRPIIMTSIELMSVASRKEDLHDTPCLVNQSDLQVGSAAYGAFPNSSLKHNRSLTETVRKKKTVAHVDRPQLAENPTSLSSFEMTKPRPVNAMHRRKGLSNQDIVIIGPNGELEKVVD